MEHVDRNYAAYYLSKNKQGIRYWMIIYEGNELMHHQTQNGLDYELLLFFKALSAFLLPL
jgi:hypothetical protein